MNKRDLDVAIHRALHAKDAISRGPVPHTYYVGVNPVPYYSKGCIWLPTLMQALPEFKLYKNGNNYDLALRGGYMSARSLDDLTLNVCLAIKDIA